MKEAAAIRPLAGRTPIKVGDLVTVGIGGTSFKGMIVEDRGAIGVGGRRLYGVTEIDVEPTSLELPEESFQAVTSLGSEQYLDELYRAIVAAAARTKADVIVSYYGRGDVQIRGHSILPNVLDRSRIVEEIDRMLAEESEKSSGRVLRCNREPAGHQSKQNWYVVRAG